MNRYEFVLTFSLPPQGANRQGANRQGANPQGTNPQGTNPELYLDALFEAGCDDASVGIGRHGMIGLDFTRSADSAEAALRSAIQAVQSAIPGATLVQAGPDLVGLTDMARIFGFSRQNMRKYATGQSGTRGSFPAPVVTGEPSLWHLAEILTWLGTHTAVDAAPGMLEVAKAAAAINHARDAERLRKIHETA